MHVLACEMTLSRRFLQNVIGLALVYCVVGANKSKIVSLLVHDAALCTARSPCDDSDLPKISDRLDSAWLHELRRIFAV